MRGASVPTEFQIVITGAGISRDAPADLPGAEDLTLEVWNALASSFDPTIDPGLDAAVRRRLGSMRMEQVLELVTQGRALPVRLVVNVYRRVGNAAFNENHLRLAALDVQHFTLNMDSLIEDAGPGARVVHLHGRWNRPKTIRTTVGHYSRGLSRRLTHRFGRALKGSNVLVIGYSGRDLDVITMFGRYRPAFITWVNRDPEEWEREVQHLRAEYDRDSPDHFKVEPLWAGEYLPTLVLTVPIPGPRRKDAPETGLEDDIAKISPERRSLAVAQLLFGMGLFDELHALLDGQTFRGAVEIRRRKILARTLSREGRFDDALGMLRSPPKRASEVGPWLMNVNEVSALANRAQGSSTRELRLAIALGSILFPTRTLRRMRLLIRVRAAKRLAVAGEARRAAEALRRIVDRRNAHRVLEEPNYADALTWYANALKSIGDLPEALKAAERATRLREYCLPGQAAYAQWKYAEVQAAGGRSDLESDGEFILKIMRDLDDAIDLASQADDKDALSWIHGTAAEVLSDVDPARARWHIEEAAALGAGSPARGGFASGYHLLQRAVVEAAEGQLDAAAATAEQAVDLLASSTVPGGALQGQQTLATIRWRQDATRDLASDLLALAARFADADMPLNKARVLVAAAGLNGRDVDDQFATIADRNGWHDLVRRARHVVGPFPWKHDLLL